MRRLVVFLAEQQEASAAGDTGSGASPRALLKQWDESWLNFLSLFVVWKKQDAAAMEAEVRCSPGPLLP